MKGLLDRGLASLARGIRRNRVLSDLLRSRVRAVLDRRIDLDPLPVLGTFVDSEGQEFELRAGLRDLVRPGWRGMLVSEPRLPSRPEMRSRMAAARASVRDLTHLAEAHGRGVAGARVLEIGCHDGLRGHALAEAGAARVAGTDITAYYVRQAAGEAESAGMANHLAELRTLARRMGRSGAPVEILEDDIGRSSLPDRAFDLVFSWEVLEHLEEPDAAFPHVARVLAPGGLAVHEYNPFLSFAGGHSLCTLDFAWGHARLDGRDFERYVRRWRPAEAGAACRFFQRNRNRLTLAELGRLARAAGLETLAVLPFPDRGHVGLVTETILSQVRRLHPTATLADLVCPTVRVLHRRPG